MGNWVTKPNHHHHHHHRSANMNNEDVTMISAASTPTESYPLRIYDPHMESDLSALLAELVLIGEALAVLAGRHDGRELLPYVERLFCCTQRIQWVSLGVMDLVDSRSSVRSMR